MRADHAKNADDLAPLIAKMFGGQVDSLMKDLLNEGHPTAATPQSSNAWLEPAIREAEKDKARAFRATRVDLSLERHQATVNSVFVVQLANGKWETIWSDHAIEDGSQARPSAEANITGDPQIKSALALLKSLGTGGDDQVAQPSAWAPPRWPPNKRSTTTSPRSRRRSSANWMARPSRGDSDAAAHRRGPFAASQPANRFFTIAR